MLPKEKNIFSKRNRKIPGNLIYEMMDGNPIYYKGYRSVLNKTKTIDDIMGSSVLQSFILMYLQMILFKKLDLKNFIILSNELGLHIGTGNNLACDLLVYDKEKLTVEKIRNNYADIPPEIAIEIDTKADLTNIIFQKYISNKTSKLLDFGVKKVIWIFTYSQQVNISEPGKDWIVSSWNKEIEIMNGINFNIGNYLKENGIEVE